MDEQRMRSEQEATRAAGGRRVPEWAEQATTALRQEWSSDRVVDQGDTHDKGEASLCVGEAA